MNILIRDITEPLNAAIDQAAAAAGLSKQELLLTLLVTTYAEPPAVVGWVKLDRRGELDGADCPECGQQLDEVWAGLLTNGQWIAPRCKWCATSE
jgi:hypothetical protein